MGEEEQYRGQIEEYLLWSQESLAWGELCPHGPGCLCSRWRMWCQQWGFNPPCPTTRAPGDAGTEAKPDMNQEQRCSCSQPCAWTQHTHKEWDFLGLRSQGNVYTTCGKLGLRYRAAHCADFPAQELVSTQECKPKASWTFCILCFYHAILLIHFHVFWGICVFFIQIYPISPLLVRLIGRWLYLPFHRIWENMLCEQPWFVYKLLL